MMDINVDLLHWSINYWQKASGGAIKNDYISNKDLAKKLLNRNIKNFRKIKVHPPFIDNSWCANLVDMQLITKSNEAIRFLLDVIDIFSRYAWVIPFRVQKGIIISNAL